MNVILSIINSNVSRSAKHNHPCWELVYRLSGNSDTMIDNVTHSISKGDLYLIPPNVYHEDTAQEPFSDLAIHIDDFLFTDTLVLHDYDSCIYYILQTIYRVINKKENNYQVVANSLADALFQYIRAFSFTLDPNQFVNKLKNVIFENIGNIDFDLTKEIRHTNYNPDYVSRCFKACTKKTPLSYLIGLRIDLAKKLLVMPTCESIKIISANCGFRDPFYFSSCFKKHVGLSPLQYRKQNSTNNNRNK